MSVGQGELGLGGGWDVMGLAGMGMLDWGAEGGTAGLARGRQIKERECENFEILFVCQIN